MRHLFLVLLILGMVSSIGFATDVTGVTVINDPGNYVLTTDLIDVYANYNVYIYINTSNVDFDCDGHLLSDSSSFGSGVMVAIPGSNITVKNCIITGFRTGFYANDSIDNSFILNNTINFSNTAGIWINRGINDTFDRNTVYNCSGYGTMNTGINLYNVSNSVITNNMMYNNPNHNLEIVGSNNVLINNTAFNSYGYTIDLITYYGGNGIYIHNYGLDIPADNYTLINNTAFNNREDGFRMSYGVNYTVINNTAYNSNYSGFELGRSGITLDGNIAYNNTQGILNYPGGSGNIFVNNIAHNNTYYGMSINGNNSLVANNIVYGNGAWDNPGWGIGFSGSGSIFINNTAYNNWQDLSFTGDDSSVTNNTAYGMGRTRLLVFSTNSNVSGNTAYSDPGSVNAKAFHIEVNNSNVTDNTAYGTGVGFFIDGSDSTFRNNTAFKIYYAGFDINGDGNHFSDDTAYRNNYYGQDSIAFKISNATSIHVSNLHLYNNSNDLQIFNSSISRNVNLTNVTFDNPNGDFQNFTSLDVSDVVGPNEQYSLTWAMMPTVSPLPANYISFRQKFVAIKNESGTHPSIDSITWRWQDDEVPTFNDNAFSLLRFYDYSGGHYGWVSVNATLDPLANTLTATNVVPNYNSTMYGGEVYGVMQYIDTVPPTVSIQSPTNTTYNKNSVQLNYTAADDIKVDKCWFRLDGGAENHSIDSCTNTTLTGLSNAAHSVTVYANDTSGNQGSATVYFSVSVDSTPPTVIINSPINNSLYNTNMVWLNYTVSDNVAVDRCWYRLDGVNYSLLNCGNTTLTGLSNANHTVTVYANDTSGNNGSSDTVYFIVNTAACGSIAVTVNEKNSSGKGKAVTTPLSGATVSAFPLADSCVSTNQRNASAVLSTCPPPSGSCVTTSTGKCTIGSLAPGSYLVIVNSTRYAVPQSSSAKLVDCKTKSVTLTFNTALALFSEPSFWESGTLTILLVALVVVAGVGVLYFTRRQGPPEEAETPAKRYKPRR